MAFVKHITPANGNLDAEEMLNAAVRRGEAALDEASAKALLSAAGINVPRGVRLATCEVDEAVLSELRPPFVLKALSSVPLHKSDIGAVQLNLADAQAVSSAARNMAQRLEETGETPSGFLVEEMESPGIEIVIGGLIDPQLGPAIMLGAGGIYAEILKDISFRLCPITRGDALRMIEELHIAPVLKGARGKAGVDLEAIVSTVLALGGEDGLFSRYAGQISEFDINPLIARADGLTAVDARIVLGKAKTPKTVIRDPDFSRLFRPAAIAVAGASATGTSAGNRFIRLLKATGYPGHIYPIHPKAHQIEGIPAFPDLSAMPTPADYAYLTVPAQKVVEVLRTAKGRLGFAQVMASADPAAQSQWESELVAISKEQQVRIIGPNCMGTHSPQGRFTFIEGVLVEPGAVGVACQSGGLGMDILRRGQELGLRFSGLVTIGNSIDVGPSDLVKHYLDDPSTRVIGLYVEDLRGGDRFVDLVRQNEGRKPIVVLVGGVTGLGRAAAASHTGAMGGSSDMWQALSRQTGVIVTDTLDRFLEQLLLCQTLTPRPETVAQGITLFGNGGGASVLGSDAVDRAGLKLARPTKAAQTALEQLALPPGASLKNPIDLPASVLKEEEGRIAARILDVNRREVKPHATIIHLNLPVIMGYRHVDNFLPNLLNAVFGSESQSTEHRLLVLRSDRSEEVDAWRRAFRAEAIHRGVPTFDEVSDAVEALARFRDYELFLTDRGKEPRSCQTEKGSEYE